MKISLIVAYGNQWQIGLNNQLLWNIPEDLKKFKQLTINKTVIMGRKTFESLGKPLINRTNIIISNNKDYKAEGAIVFNCIEESLEFCKKKEDKEIFFIGGAQIYEKAFDLIDSLYVSEVDYNDSADTYIKPIDFTNWILKDEKKYDTIIESGKIKTLAWKFKYYEIKNEFR